VRNSSQVHNRWITGILFFIIWANEFVKLSKNTGMKKKYMALTQTLQMVSWLPEERFLLLLVFKGMISAFN
jgi:hypothetical protein